MKNDITLPVSVGYSAEVEKNQERIKKGSLTKPAQEQPRD